MHTPDGMGADRYRERQNMQRAAHERQREACWSVVDPTTFDVIERDLGSREAAEQWLADNGHRFEHELQVQNIG